MMFARCAALLALTLAGCSNSAASTAAASADAPTVAATNRPAPNFSQKTADGRMLTLAQYKGKVVYLNFFATWCPPCNEEASWIQTLQQHYATRGLQVIGVDVLENQAKARSFVAEHKLTYPAVVDDGTLRDAYSINGLPVHAFIDRSGVLRDVTVGEMSRAEIEATIRKLL